LLTPTHRQRRQPLVSIDCEQEKNAVPHHDEIDGSGNSDRVRVGQHRNSIEQRKSKQHSADTLVARAKPSDQEESQRGEQKLCERD